MFSVLFVFSLLRWCGWGKGGRAGRHHPAVRVDEGYAERRRPSCRPSLISRQYRAHVAQRRNRQTIMLGFSDGTKDGGFLTGQLVDLYNQGEAVRRFADDNGIKAIFFDGRGGPPARGGGKTQSLLCVPWQEYCQPRHSIHHSGPNDYQHVWLPKRISSITANSCSPPGCPRVCSKKKIRFPLKDRQVIEKLAQVSF